jgi:IS30 family transposase
MKIELSKSISHETIYSYIHHDKTKGGILYTLLSHRGKRYRYGRNKGTTINNRVDISKRPAIVETTTRIGGFEIDTVVSARHTGYSCLLTMVDRRSKFVFIRKLANKSTLEAQLGIEDIYQNSIVPFRSLTSDNGTEFANHESISANIACEFYFARPYRSIGVLLVQYYLTFLVQYSIVAPG